MKNTGFLFFIMRATRLIVAMFVLFAVCKPTVTGVAIIGAQNLAPSCEKNIEDLCKNDTAGTLEEVEVTLRDCTVTCTYRLAGPKTVLRGDVWVQNRGFEKVNLPEGMPCAFGAKCKDGKCICKFCNENINNKKPRLT
ncbi:uncharacterized protein LOC120841499 [Ixodes scapularis]|uniref:uncharacterized protein LOC120841499 n=1 Tax=Ixodes scapularis TaxID=6945 RepID=UPI001A9DAB37|nr:uncharacterized protein LOC120841499 [Ixodes scapularis]